MLVGGLDYGPTVEDRDLSAQEAAHLFGIPSDTIHKWHARRKLAPSLVMRGPGRKGEQPLFRLSEVAGLVAERHAKQQATAARSERVAE